MPWQITLHSNPQIVETCYTGIVSPTELAEAVSKTLSMAQSHHSIWFLADCSALEGGHSVFDLYGLLDAIADKDLGADFREALIVPASKTSREMVEFWETAVQNRGFAIRIFENKQDALKWLMG